MYRLFSTFESVPTLYSRGAGRVVLVDSNPRCTRWIESTLQKIGSRHEGLIKLGEHRVYRHDLTSGLGWIRDQFDIIFSGAPYVDEKKRPIAFVQFLLEEIAKSGLLDGQGLFIAQHSVRETFRIPEGWDYFRQEKYGDSALSF